MIKRPGTKTFDTIGCLLVLYNLDRGALIVQHYIDLTLTLKSFAFPICILTAGANSLRENGKGTGGPYICAIWILKGNSTPITGLSATTGIRLLGPTRKWNLQESSKTQTD